MPRAPPGRPTSACSRATTRPTRGRRPRARSTSRSTPRGPTDGSGSSSRSAPRPPIAWSASRPRTREPWFDAWPDAVDATPLLAARARGQDRAGDRAHAARQRDRGGGDGARPLQPRARDEGERGGGDLERLRPRARHGLGGQGRARARLLARLVGAGHPDLHGDRRPAGAGARADAVRDLGLRRRLLVRPHEEPLPGRAHARVRAAAGEPHRRLRPGRRPLSSRVRASPSSTG